MRTIYRRYTTSSYRRYIPLPFLSRSSVGKCPVWAVLLGLIFSALGPSYHRKCRFAEIITKTCVSLFRSKSGHLAKPEALAQLRAVKKKKGSCRNTVRTCRRHSSGHLAVGNGRRMLPLVNCVSNVKCSAATHQLKAIQSNVTRDMTGDIQRSIMVELFLSHVNLSIHTPCPNYGLRSTRCPAQLPLSRVERPRAG
jgi:hypothetical protein